MFFNKKDGESNVDFHKRLVYGKLVDKTLADEDYSELSKYLYGKEYSTDVARRMMYGSCKTLALIDEEKKSKVLKGASVSEDSYEELADLIGEYEKVIVQARVEKQKFFDYRNAFNATVRSRSREEEINEIIQSAIRDNNNLPILNEVSNSEIKPTSDDKSLLVSLNDIHYGASVDNHWCKYNPDICKKMIEHYYHRIIEIADRHNTNKCVVWCNGDCISGNIHKSIAVTNKENVIKQIIGVSELICQFLANLQHSGRFDEIEFYLVAGNHSRIERKEDASKDERLDDIIEWYAKARLQNFSTIKICDNAKIDNTIYTFDVNGKTFVGVHGDFDLGQSKITALQQMVGKPIYAILLGHMHHNKVDTVQGIRVMMAGSFLGTDDYCVTKRIYGHPEQLVSVMSSDGIVCDYPILLDKYEK